MMALMWYRAISRPLMAPNSVPTIKAPMMAGTSEKFARVNSVAKVHEDIPAIAATERSMYPAAKGISAARAIVATTVWLLSVVIRLALEKKSAEVRGSTQKNTTTAASSASSP